MMDQFLRRKKQQFMKKDPSYIGEIDKDIKKLIELINSKESYYTTSSCSGRIVFIKEKPTKEPGLFLWMKHDRTSFKELKNEIKKASENKRDLIYLKQEACLVVVACKTLDDAQKLLDKAQFAGWKNSGIIATKKRIILQLISTERMDCPVVDRGKILISNEALKVLIKEANSKLERTREKVRKLEGQLR